MSASVTYPTFTRAGHLREWWLEAEYHSVRSFFLTTIFDKPYQSKKFVHIWILCQKAQFSESKFGFRFVLFLLFEWIVIRKSHYCKAKNKLTDSNILNMTNQIAEEFLSYKQTRPKQLSFFLRPRFILIQNLFPLFLMKSSKKCSGRTFESSSPMNESKE